jgi:hypothetical protein
VQKRGFRPARLSRPAHGSLRPVPPPHLFVLSLPYGPHTSVMVGSRAAWEGSGAARVGGYVRVCKKGGCLCGACTMGVRRNTRKLWHAVAMQGAVVVRWRACSWRGKSQPFGQGRAQTYARSTWHSRAMATARGAARPGPRAGGWGWAHARGHGFPGPRKSSSGAGLRHPGSAARHGGGKGTTVGQRGCVAGKGPCSETKKGRGPRASREGSSAMAGSKGKGVGSGCGLPVVSEKSEGDAVASWCR